MLECDAILQAQVISKLSPDHHLSQPQSHRCTAVDYGRDDQGRPIAIVVHKGQRSCGPEGCQHLDIRLSQLVCAGHTHPLRRPRKRIIDEFGSISGRDGLPPADHPMAPHTFLPGQRLGLVLLLGVYILHLGAEERPGPVLPEIPDYQTLMLPVLRLAAEGETTIPKAVECIGAEFGLSPDQMAVPSLASPREQRALGDPVSARHRTHRHSRLVRSFDDPCLILERAAPPSFGPLKHLDPHRPDPLTLTPALRSGSSPVRDAVEHGHHRTRTINAMGVCSSHHMAMDRSLAGPDRGDWASWRRYPCRFDTPR
ncbi:hypothetical protein MPOCJGCO_4940 [Methylobacterium trifolii]|uniref:Uncharacterized protein n=1 Tax=Methylobacterium trifolii TaxID=1003092 RepID=A0ABQ4U5R9_9HYPH|nr:hypothetical protein MPOCJGCO_4940 [Methylobacterium trifolii]